MPFTSLLGKALKDDEVLEVLENFDMPVIYDFDRMHEGIDDVYWAAAHDEGFQFRFDQNQVLDVVYLYLVPREGYAAIDRSRVQVSVFETFDEAEQHCVHAKVPYQTSAGEPGSGAYKCWIKLDHGAYTAHYQFKDGRVCMLTLSAKAES